MVTRRLAGGYANIDAVTTPGMSSFGTATSSFGPPTASSFGTGSFSPAASASMPLSSVGSDAYGRIRPAAHSHRPVATSTSAGLPGSASPVGAYSQAHDGRVGGITSRSILSSRESLAASGRPQSLSFGTSTGELSGNKTPTNMRNATGASITGGVTAAEISGNTSAYMRAEVGVAGSFGSHAKPPRTANSFPASSLLLNAAGGGSTSQLTKKRPIHDGPGAPVVCEGQQVEALVRGRWVRATVLSVDAQDTRQGMGGRAGRCWMVHCDHEAEGVCSFADHVKPLTSASYVGKREFQVGDRVQALFESQWFLGVIAKVPEQDKEQLGRWTVQCDGDQEGCFTYAVHIRAAPAGTPPPPRQANFVEGDRVEAYYKGTWLQGTVVRIPKDDASGRWAIQCDADAQGTLTYVRQVRRIGDLTVKGIDKPKAKADVAAPTAPTVVKGQQELFKEGDRVEGFYEGEWFEGTIVRTPKDDKDGFGRWTLQCDDDAEGIRTYCKQVRAVGNESVKGVRSAVDKTLQAQAKDAKQQTGNGNSAATGPGGKEVDVPEVVISQGMAKNGETFIVVTDLQGTKLETFQKMHIEFEVAADTKSLNHWLEGLRTEVLPGLLMILGQEVNSRGASLKQLEQDKEALRGMEDYQFFGLNEDASDKDVEKAYKRMSTKLHPDKGGDASQFADMKKRFDELKEMRNDGTKKSKGDGEIKWDSKSRSSMMSAHSDLHMQLVWITKQCSALEVELEDLRAKQRIYFSLTNGEESSQNGVQAAVSTAGAAVHLVEEMHMAERENTFLPDVDPLLGSEETLDPEEVPTIKLEPDTVQQALQEQAAAQHSQVVQQPTAVSYSAEDWAPVTGTTASTVTARVLGGGIHGSAPSAGAPSVELRSAPSASMAPSQLGSSLAPSSQASSFSRGMTPATGRLIGAQPASVARPVPAVTPTASPGITGYSAAAGVTSYAQRVVGNGMISGALRHSGDISPRFGSNLRSGGGYR
mmetsp:Transcript_94829/g.182255  ORF Transcript_94829/g.182255 Transcript_94829/m.182255 type:complete len:985 (-) Transcript_94829:69-3023(-)